ncbi:MAG: hypothetical protein JWM50_2428 [Microbacteriaceae bacterium]|nr:hypothetical protein [Microbacteriaceae bacterium]
MDKQLSAALVLLFLVVVLALMVLGWRARKRRQSALGEPQHPPADLGVSAGDFPGLYVATTIAGEPLNRVAVRGLGFRARTTVSVSTAGVVLPVAGQVDTFIPAGDVTAVGRASWAIDRVVEPDGLVFVGWNLGGDAVDSYFRVEDADGLLAALASIAPAAHASVAPGSTEPASTERDST